MVGVIKEVKSPGTQNDNEARWRYSILYDLRGYIHLAKLESYWILQIIPGNEIIAGIGHQVTTPP